MAPQENDHVIQEEEGEIHSQAEENPASVMSILKLAAASVFIWNAIATYNNVTSDRSTSINFPHRRLTQTIIGDKLPTYMGSLMNELKERKKLMEETPPEEVKYWFEYTGPLQKYYYRYSKSRGKADYFEGRDDSGVTSARFMDDPLGNQEYEEFLMDTEVPEEELSQHARLLENCMSMGSSSRPNMGKGTIWNEWFGKKQAPSGSSIDRCRVLFTINTVGAGRGTTMLWETNPPALNSAGPIPWTSEQATASTHLERNLKEIDAMCATGQIAARVQMLVCEPIPGKWTEWMDSMLVNCGGKPAPIDTKNKGGSPYEGGIKVEERPSPVQVVVVASAGTADTCHDLKSGFMEKRMQDLIIAPPFLGDSKVKSTNPAIKTTHPDLVSSDDHDIYVAMKWSSLVTIRAVNGFLQASADLAAAAASPRHRGEKPKDGVTVALSNAPSSPFLIPSFVRVSYVSEENSKVAKWRMHGDFFHPAAWEVCKDSYDMTWIPDSLSGAGGVNGICYDESIASAGRKLADGEDCGQWWVYMAEEQMPTTPEVYANEVTAPLVQGGSNYFWMVTERQRQEIVKMQVCEHENQQKDSKKCGQSPQAVIPLGDLESFLINFTPNTALGKKHITGRRPGYSREKEREADREKVRERKQLKGQEDIEKALFDYTIYPAALFHKDATLKAARSRDDALTKSRDKDAVGPQTVKSSYFDVTITKPREATTAWCQSIARKGLCVLYSDYFRTSNDQRCMEACGMKMNWSLI